MGLLLKLFTGNPVMMIWVGLGLFAAGAASGGAAAWTVNGWRLGTQLEHAKTELATCSGSLARTQDANKAFAGAVTDQTNSIRALEVATLERDQRAAAAAAEAAKQGKQITDKADALLSRPLPQSPAQDCAALGSDLDDAVRERKGRRQ